MVGKLIRPGNICIRGIRRQSLCEKKAMKRLRLLRQDQKIFINRRTQLFMWVQNPAGNALDDSGIQSLFLSF